MPAGAGNFYGLRRFEVNQPLMQQITAARLNTILDAVDQGVVRYGRGIYGSRTTGGQTVNARRTRQGTNIIAPFNLAVRRNPDDPLLFQAMVNEDSDCMLSMKPTNWISIVGLGTWFNLIANDVITIYMPVTNYIPTSAHVQSYGMGTTTFDPTSDPWNSGDNGIVFDDSATPPAQAGLNIMIAYSTPDAHDNPYVIQCQNNHLLIEAGIIAGRACVYDFSHRRRYGITAPGI